MVMGNSRRRSLKVQKCNQRYIIWFMSKIVGEINVKHIVILLEGKKILIWIYFICFKRTCQIPYLQMLKLECALTISWVTISDVVMRGYWYEWLKASSQSSQLKDDKPFAYMCFFIWYLLQILVCHHISLCEGEIFDLWIHTWGDKCDFGCLNVVKLLCLNGSNEFDHCTILFLIFWSNFAWIKFNK